MTPADFIAAFPAFANTPPPAIQAQIDRSANYFSLSRWGVFLNDGLGNWIAHYLTIGAVNGATPSGIAVAGDVTDKHVGSVSVGRSGELLGKQMDNPFMRTLYGQEYYRLVRLVGAGTLTV